jgi:hypothetical protein
MPYLAQWRARAAAAATLGDRAFIWQRGGRHFVGLRYRNGRKVILGEGTHWQEALDAAARNAPSQDPDRLSNT